MTASALEATENSQILPTDRSRALGRLKFADSGGWGYAEFEYDAASDTFRPGTLADQPPQANDAKCGFTCHTVAQTRDYVFTEYGHR